MAKYDAKEITESFFAHKGIKISTQAGKKKAAAFLKKAQWSDMFISEKLDSIEWSDLDKKVGKKRLEIMKGYIGV